MQNLLYCSLSQLMREFHLRTSTHERPEMQKNWGAWIAPQPFSIRRISHDRNFKDEEELLHISWSRTNEKDGIRDLRRGVTPLKRYHGRLLEGPRCWGARVEATGMKSKMVSRRVRPMDLSGGKREGGAYGCVCRFERWFSRNASSGLRKGKQK